MERHLPSSKLPLLGRIWAKLEESEDRGSGGPPRGFWPRIVQLPATRWGRQEGRRKRGRQDKAALDEPNFTANPVDPSLSSPRQTPQACTMTSPRLRPPRRPRAAAAGPAPRPPRGGGGGSPTKPSAPRALRRGAAAAPGPARARSPQLSGVSSRPLRDDDGDNDAELAANTDPWPAYLFSAVTFNWFNISAVECVPENLPELRLR